jgi:hypothetical protein
MAVFRFADSGLCQWQHWAYYRHSTVNTMRKQDSCRRMLLTLTRMKAINQTTKRSGWVIWKVEAVKKTKVHY